MSVPSSRTAARNLAAVTRTELTFMTWNVHGHCPDTRFEPAAVADVIARIGADVVALQEVGAMAGAPEHASAIAALLGMHPVFAPNVSRRRGRWRCGNALLTRFPVVESVNHDLSVAGVEPRGCLLARLETPGGELLAASAHLGLGHRERARQAERLQELFAPESDPLLLGADANDWFPGQDTRTLRRSLTDAWTSAGSGARSTYPAMLPLLRIDHVYVRPPVDPRLVGLRPPGALPLLARCARSIEVLGCETAASARIRATSDHLPVVARVAVTGGTAMVQRQR